MTLLGPDQSQLARAVFDLGYQFIKQAGTPVPACSLAGRLYISQSGWGLLHVPNSFGRGLFAALQELGAELPNGPEYDAHISVFTKDEVAQIGADKLTERGKAFRYNLGQLKTVKPQGEGEYSRVWFVEVHSPELKQLRKSYGLPPLLYGDHPFHITIAYRRKKVLQDNEVAKAAARIVRPNDPEVLQAAGVTPLDIDFATEPEQLESMLLQTSRAYERKRRRRRKRRVATAIKQALADNELDPISDATLTQLLRDMSKGAPPDALPTDKQAEDRPGIPDRRYYGNVADIPENALRDFVISRHLAERAGCFRHDTPVDMADGTTKPISEIKPGDYVSTPAGAVPVIRIWDNGVGGEWVRVTTGDNTIIVTVTHPFWVKTLGWVPVGELIGRTIYVSEKGCLEVDSETLRCLRSKGYFQKREDHNLQRVLCGGTESSALRTASVGAFDGNRSKHVEEEGVAILEKVSGGKGTPVKRQTMVAGDILGSRVNTRGNCCAAECVATVSEQCLSTLGCTNTNRAVTEDVEQDVWPEKLQMERRGLQRESSGFQRKQLSANQGPEAIDGRARLELRVVSFNAPGGSSSHDSVSVFEKSQQRNSTMQEVSRCSRTAISGAGRKVFCVERLPRLRERRYDIEVGSAEHCYYVAGCLVHNSHFDVRFGDPKGLYSWATRKGLPGPGGIVSLFRQPMHDFRQLHFEGTIPSGQYGGGTVKKSRSGQLLFTKVSPNSLHFTLGDKKHPERFVMIKPEKQLSRRQESWLLINVTPTVGLPYNKLRYKRLPAAEVDKFLEQMQTGDSIEAKLDGSSSLVKLLKDRVELVSYRQSQETGRPILHTERVLAGNPQLKIPPELVNTVLKGEIIGTRKADDKETVLSPQELGGILNSSLAEALRKQQESGISLKSVLYDIQQLGNQPVDVHTVPRAERRKMLEQVLQHLPADKFSLSPAATTPEEAKQLWQQVRSGTHPLTHEGIVIWPRSGPPMKSKLLEDSDVHVRSVFPGEGKYKNVGAGGFEYSLEPEGEIVGRVGTGFSDELRKAMLTDPQSYIGRVARIHSQQQFPSGAHRAPALLAFHEDYPLAKTSAVLKPPLLGLTVEKLAELDIGDDELDLQKEARFYIGEALRSRLARPLAWNKQRGLLQNAYSVLRDVSNDAQLRMQQAYGDDRLLAALSPEHGWQRLFQSLQGDDPVVTNPYDKLLQSIGPQL